VKPCFSDIVFPSVVPRTTDFPDKQIMHVTLHTDVVKHGSHKMMSWWWVHWSSGPRWTKL